MDGPQITALTGLLTTIGAGIGWLIVRWDKKRPAVPRKQAITAQASQATAEALAAVQESLTADLERVRREADEDRERARADREQDRLERTADRARIGSLEREVHYIRDGWNSWYRDLTDRWHHHRSRDFPPKPPTLD